MTQLVEFTIFIKLFQQLSREFEVFMLNKCSRNVKPASLEEGAGWGKSFDVNVLIQNII